MPAELFLDVRRGLVDRRDDGAGRRVGLLTGVDADGREARAGRGVSRSGSYQESDAVARGARRPIPVADSAIIDLPGEWRSSRVPDRPAPGRGGLSPPPGADPLARRRATCCSPRGPAASSSFAAALKIIVALTRLVGELPAVRRRSSAAPPRSGSSSRSAFFAWRLFVLVKRRLLWRVRRKLILSYIFIGVVPSLLIVDLLPARRRAHLHERQRLPVQGRVRLARRLRQARDRVGGVGDVARARRSATRRSPRIHRNELATVSRAVAGVCPASGPDPSAAASPPPGSRCCVQRRPRPVGAHRGARGRPDWLPRRSFPGGTIVVPSPDDPAQVELVIRAALPVVVGGATVGIRHHRSADRRRHGRSSSRTRPACTPARVADRRRTEKPVVDPRQDRRAPERRHVDDAFRQEPDVPRLPGLGHRERRGASASRSAIEPAQLYRRLSDAQQIVVGGRTLGERAVVILLLIAVLFLIIEAVALGMGLALARSITSSVHELFMGTERVRHGDFTHRIDVRRNDQLGELAGSFNQMTGSIEGLLQTAAEKKRLEEELRIARVIQMSLLPRGPLDVAGPRRSRRCACRRARWAGTTTTSSAARRPRSAC